MSTIVAPLPPKGQQNPQPLPRFGRPMSAGDGWNELMPWWAYKTAERSLRSFHEALCGRSRFSFRIVPRGGCYTEFDPTRRVTIDPLMAVSDDTAEHAAIVKGKISHEDAHVLYTTPFYGFDPKSIDLRTALIARVCNILEDERIERAMAHSHWGTEKYIRLLKAKMYETHPEVEGADDPSEVLNAILAVRFGGAIKGTLSAKNQALYAKCWPWVLRAWNGRDTAVVRESATEIVKILGLEEITRRQLEAIEKAMKAMGGSCKGMKGKRGDPAEGMPGGGMGMPGESGTCAGDGSCQQGEGEGGGSGTCVCPPKDGSESGEGAGEGDKADADKADGDKDGKAKGKGKGDKDGKGAGDEADADKADGDKDGKAKGKGKGDKDGKGQDHSAGIDTHQFDAQGAEAAERAEKPQPMAADSGAMDPMDKAEQAQVVADEKGNLQATFRGAGGLQATNCPLQPRNAEDIYEEALRRSQVLVRQIERIPPRPRVKGCEDGPRYSMRDELRNPDRPMRKVEAPTRQRTIALGILVDCSGSMGGIMAEVQKAVLSIYLAGDTLRVPVAVWGFSSWSGTPAVEVVGWDRKLYGATAPEAIAGLAAGGGTILAPALRSVSQTIHEVSRVDRRILLCVHDGSPGDMGPSKIEVEKLKRDNEVIGIYLGSSEWTHEIEGMRELFGERLIIAQDADALMPVLGAFLVRTLRPSGC